MTPKEKAKELVDKMDLKQMPSLNLARNEINLNDTFFNAKQCALIAVDEILKSEPRYPNNVDWDDVGGTHQYYYEAQHEEALNYWEEVKQEISKL